MSAFAPGATALRDAVYLGLAGASDNQSRALLLEFSDGFDTASFLSSEAIIESARRSNAVVHVVHFRADKFLGRLAETTGGRTWSADPTASWKSCSDASWTRCGRAIR